MERLKLCISVIITLLLTVPTFKGVSQQIKGNYALITGGQECPFDTAVAIQINQYRVESESFNLCDSLIYDYQEYAISLERQSEIQDSLLAINKIKIKEKDNIISSKSELNNKLFIAYNVLYEEATRKKKIWQRPEFFIGIGTVIGYIIGRQ